MKRLLAGLHPAWYAVTLIVAAELVLPLRFRSFFRAGEDLLRNPYGSTAWNAYIRATCPPPGGRRMLILSNSQANGVEYGQDKIYPFLLREKLRAAAPGSVHLANWSIAAGRAPEMALLLARAREFAPDTLLLVTSPGCFDPQFYAGEEGGDPVSPFRSDLQETAWWHRGDLAPSYRHRYLDLESAVQSGLSVLLPTYEFRTIPYFHLQQKVPWLRGFTSPDRKAPGRRKAVAGPALRAQPPGEEVPLPEEALMEMVVDTGAGLNCRKILVLQPHPFAENKSESQSAALLAEYFSRRGWEVWDTRGDTTWRHFFRLQEAMVGRHFTEAGHQRYADALFARLAPNAAGMRAETAN
jgi:hypothetical protein